MQLFEYLTASLSDLVRQKLRTLLTMLGIIFGVGAVISMLSIGAGAQAQALEVIDSMGLRNIIIRDKPVGAAGPLYHCGRSSLGLSLARPRRSARRSRRMSSRTSAGKRDPLGPGNLCPRQGAARARSWASSREHLLRLDVTCRLEAAERSSMPLEELSPIRRVCRSGESACAAGPFRVSWTLSDKAVKINEVWFTVVGSLDTPEPRRRIPSRG